MSEGPRVALAELAAWCAASARVGIDGRGRGRPTWPIDEAERARLVRILVANRLGPAIDAACADEDRPEGIRADARLAAERGLGALAALREVGELLDARRVPWMLWKGPALGVQVWGEPTRRHFGDLDVVVAPESRTDALRALTDAGWVTRPPHRPRAAEAINRGGAAHPLDREGRPLLELHWSFTPFIYPQVARVADVHARAETIALAGREVRTPAGADALLLLATHATKHGWSQAEEVVSFARLAMRDPSALEEARRAADAAGVGRVIALAERLVERLIGRGALPDGSGARARVGTSGSPLTRTRDASTIDAMADACIARMLAGDGAWRRTTAWTLSWIERAADRRRFLAGSLWRPTPMEWEWLQLPEPLAVAYPAVRLARLALRSVGLARR